MSQFQLLFSRRLGPLFVTQFLGAFNDNLFKTGLTLALVFGLAGGETNLLVNLAAGLFILPFFLLAPLAGQLADRYQKAALMRWVKLAEIVIMGCGAVAWYLQSVPAMFGVLLLLGVQSAFFGPAKYAILPQHLKDTELVGGNAQVEMGTFTAILLGTLVGGALVGLPELAWVLGPLAVVLAVVGYGASRWIPDAPIAAPDLRVDWNPITQLARSARLGFENKGVLLSIMGISWFWLLGASYLTQLPNYAATHLYGDANVVTLLLATFTVGIAAGSLLCERLSGNRIEVGIVPFGALGVSLFGIHLSTLEMAAPASGLYTATSFVQSGGVAVLVDLLGLGVFGGWFVVPLNAWVQRNVPEDRRARVIALNNVMNALFMVIAAVVAALLLEGAGLSISQLFLTMALMNIAVSLFIFHQVPIFAARFLIWVLSHTAYRVRHEGLDNIPEEGAALIACNHVSYVDAVLLAGAVRRPIRFIMIHNIFDIPVLNYVFRTGRAIPIAPRSQAPEVYERAFELIDEGLAAGDLLCIFPEGGLTRDGDVQEFKAGIDKILARRPVPVIPMALRGLWGSFFSFDGGGFFKPKGRLWSRVDVVADSPWAPEVVTAGALQSHIEGMRGSVR